MGIKKRKKFKKKKKIQNGRLKKTEIFKTIVNIFFQKFHGLVLGLVQLIDKKGIAVA